jgi:hypothetical protein
MERDTHNRLSRKVDDTVGEFKSAEMGVPHMPAWKAKTLGKLAQEKVLLEPRRRFANSIPSFSLDKSGPRSWHRPPHLPLCQAQAPQHRRQGASHDPACTRTHSTSCLPLSAVTNVPNMLESCDNWAKSKKRHRKMFHCHTEWPQVADTVIEASLFQWNPCLIFSGRRK